MVGHTDRHTDTQYQGTRKTGEKCKVPSVGNALRTIRDVIRDNKTNIRKLETKFCYQVFSETAGENIVKT